jgi:hypothetical protein
MFGGKFKAVSGAYLGAVLIWACAAGPVAQAQTTDAPPSLPPLPGKGLAQHPFLYCGEWDFNNPYQSLHIVKGGKEVWRYDVKFKVMRGGREDIQELGDCTQLSNGNIIFITRFGAQEVTPDKKIVWQYLGPDNTEIHSIQAIGLDHVLLTQNGNPAKVMLIDTQTNMIEKTVELPVAKPDSVHGQFRRVHMTAAGTYLAAHMDNNKVTEYDGDGKVIWSVDAESPWDAVRLKTGNTLISSNKGYVREVNPAGQTVWEVNRDTFPEYNLKIIQEVTRLDNGNTLITNWVANTVKPEDWPKTVQVIEVTPAKKVVWALSSWKSPWLGPASSIQLLDQPGKPEEGALQR